MFTSRCIDITFGAVEATINIKIIFFTCITCQLTGFKRYFWKSLFGTSLDGLAIQAKLDEQPAHLRQVICGPRPKKRRKRRSVRRSSVSPELIGLHYTPVAQASGIPTAATLTAIN